MLEDPQERRPGTRIEITTSAQRIKKRIQAAATPKKRDEKEAEVRSIARRLLTGKTYQENLRKRLEQGIAGAVEIWLWRYAYGDPEKNDAERERERQRFEKMRAQVLHFLQSAPERAQALDAKLQRQPPKLLALPPRPAPEIVDLPPLAGNGSDRDT